MIARIVSDAQDCANAAELRSVVLSHLAGFVPFESAILLPVRQDVGLPVSIGKERRFITQFLASRDRYQPDLQKGRVAARTGRGGYLDTEVYTQNERSNLPFFAEIIRPQGNSSQLVAHVTFQRRMTCILHLCRHGRTRAFRTSDLERLLGVVPAIAVSHAAFDGAAATVAAKPPEPPAPSGNDVGAFRELFET